MNDDAYTGTMVQRLMDSVDACLEQRVPRTKDAFDNLCQAKLALADKMAEQIHDSGKESPELVSLWKTADRLQEQVIKG
jgi:hypothetical protein